MSATGETRRSWLAALAALAAGPALAQTAPVPGSPPPARPRVALQTEKGVIVIELAADRAPITVANFLRYVDSGRMTSAAFFRAAHPPGHPTVGFIQGGIEDPAKLFPPIAHESTLKTGLKHVDGTISMARLEPGSAQSNFTICSSDAPHLDANPDAPGDNLGYAAFGSVVEGMDVVRAILAMPKTGKAPTPIMEGQIIDPPLKILSARRL